MSIYHEKHLMANVNKIESINGVTGTPDDKDIILNGSNLNWSDDSDITIKNKFDSVSENAIEALSNYYTKDEVNNDFLPVSEKGLVNGLATLDNDGKIPIGQLPLGIGGEITTSNDKEIINCVGGLLSGSVDSLGLTAQQLLITNPTDTTFAGLKPVADLSSLVTQAVPGFSLVGTMRIKYSASRDYMTLNSSLKGFSSGGLLTLFTSPPAQYKLEIWQILQFKARNRKLSMYNTGSTNFAPFAVTAVINSVTYNGILTDVGMEARKDTVNSREWATIRFFCQNPVEKIIWNKPLPANITSVSNFEIHAPFGTRIPCFSDKL
jgi:hypothetical protein